MTVPETQHFLMNHPQSKENLPVFVDSDTDKIERELILKQLLFLRQDVNEIKQILASINGMKIDEINPANTALFLPPASSSEITKDLTNVEDGALNAIQNEVVGEITMSELEQEMIERVLEKFKGNRRKTSKMARGK